MINGCEILCRWGNRANYQERGLVKKGIQSEGEWVESVHWWCLIEPILIAYTVLKAITTASCFLSYLVSWVWQCKRFYSHIYIYIYICQLIKLNSCSDFLQKGTSMLLANAYHILKRETNTHLSVGEDVKSEQVCQWHTL